MSRCPAFYDAKPPGDGMDLSVVDLSPVPAGGTATDAFANTVEAARQAGRLGDRRARPEVAASAPVPSVFATGDGKPDGLIRRARRR